MQEDSLSLIVLVGKWSVMGFCGRQLRLKTMNCLLRIGMRMDPP